MEDPESRSSQESKPDKEPEVMKETLGTLKKAKEGEDQKQ